MPLDLAQLQAKSARVAVSAMGETVLVDYHPELYTLGTVHAIQSLTGEDQVDKLVEILKDLIIGWDITEDGTALLVSDAVLRRLPMQVLNGILRAIASDVGDVKNVAKPSRAG